MADELAKGIVSAARQLKKQEQANRRFATLHYNPNKDFGQKWRVVMSVTGEQGTHQSQVTYHDFIVSALDQLSEAQFGFSMEQAEVWYEKARNGVKFSLLLKTVESP